MAIANIPTLLMVLVQLTGDRSWIQDPYLPSRIQGISDNDTAGLSDELQASVRAAAFDAMTRWSCTGQMAEPSPDEELIASMLSVSTGEPVPTKYAPMVAQLLGGQLGLISDAPQTPAPDGVSALIIGAGISGIGAAIKLDQRGIPYRIVEKNSGLGGAWFENVYPGAGVDTPSHLYSYSFAKHDWQLYFSKGPHIAEYLRKVADDFAVTGNITFDAQVIECCWDEETMLWNVRIQHADGRVELVTTTLLVSAVGLFNSPVVPSLEGLDTFEGPAFHTARWPQDIDVTGKRVGIIGTGASAMQIVPKLSDEVAELVVFQRSPQWAAPFEKLDLPVPAEINWLMREVPLYEAWYRIRLAWTFNDRTYAALQRDPEWPHPERAVNEINDGYRRFFTRYIENELGDRQDLLPKMLPTYPPYAKRLLMDHGWFRTFRKPNVHLVTEGIERITPKGVLDKDGVEHELDVLVLSTGFEIVRFLNTMRVVGRNGVTLREAWDDDDARAYLGSFVPGFPNFAIMYGPNLQPGHGGSFLHMLEYQLGYLMALLDETFELGAQSFNVDQGVHDRYNQKVDEHNEHMIWTHPGVDNYYRNSRGRVVANLALRVFDYWMMSSKVDPGEWEFGYLDDAAAAAAEAEAAEV